MAVFKIPFNVSPQRPLKISPTLIIQHQEFQAQIIKNFPPWRAITKVSPTNKPTAPTDHISDSFPQTPKNIVQNFYKCAEN